MPIPEDIRLRQADMTAWRRDLHAHPETAFEERRTAHLVAERLREWGIEVHDGIARTGVVGVLSEGDSGRAIGLRADMDALDLTEETGVPWASQIAGKMHACGHDGHIAMLLGAARHLARTRRFDGTVHFIFQPAEENEGGARAMIEEGLFERFAMDEVYGLHNHPGLAIGQFAVRAGPMMASLDLFTIRVEGRGCHAAMPHKGADPIVCASSLVSALQTIASRNVDPLDAVVVSVTRIEGGTTWNVISEHVDLCGTVRTFEPRVQEEVEKRLHEIVTHVGRAHGCEGHLRYERRYPPTINAAEQTEMAAEAAAAVSGDGAVLRDPGRVMAAEDFAFMLRERPGCYLLVGNGEASAPVHNPRFDFNDEALPFGAAYWVALVEQRLRPIRAGGDDRVGVF